MDKLTKIFEMQASLDKYMIDKRNLHGYTSDEWIQKKTLALVSELAELIDEVNFKWWKAKKDKPKVKDELVDILHFFVSMCIDAGLTAEELFDMYIAKNAENIKRQQGQSTEKDYSK